MQSLIPSSEELNRFQIPKTPDEYYLLFTEKKDKIEGANVLIYFEYLKKYKEILSSINKNELVEHLAKIREIIVIIVKKTLEFSPNRIEAGQFQKEVDKELQKVQKNTSKSPTSPSLPPR